MSYKVLALPHFNRALKRLSSKYPSLKNEISNLYDSLEREPKQGTSIGKDCYKIRLSIASKGKGKSGGTRVITYLRIMADEVYLLTIYDKSEKTDLNAGELEQFLKDL